VAADVLPKLSPYGISFYLFNHWQQMLNQNWYFLVSAARSHMTNGGHYVGKIGTYWPHHLNLLSRWQQKLNQKLVYFSFSC
jgi:hypothetical protein